MKEKMKSTVEQVPGDVAEILKVVSQWPWGIRTGVLKELREPPALAANK